MEITQDFEKLSEIKKDSIINFERTREVEKVFPSSKKSEVVLLKSGVVRKHYINGGDRCHDVEALKILGQSEYFPTLYAFEKNDYFYMQRAKGESLLDISNSRESVDVDEIYEKILVAFGQMVSVGYLDNDMKIEHIFWDNSTKKLTWIDLELCQKIYLKDPLNYIFRNFEKIVDELNDYFKSNLQLTGVKEYFKQILIN